MSSYAENGGIILASDIVVQDEASVTYRWYNDGNIPDYVTAWGYRQSIGVVLYEVEITPGTGSPRERTIISFSVRTVVGGEPIIVTESFGNSRLVRWGTTEDDLIEIEAVKPADNPNTALWTVSLGKNWFSSYTTVGTVRCNARFNVLGRAPTTVEISRNEVEAEPPRRGTWEAYEPVRVSRGKRTQ
jgi:hypothetical protein